jgi:hypothetical protein
MRHFFIVAMLLSGLVITSGKAAQQKENQGTPITVTPLAAKPCPTCDQTRTSFLTNSAITQPLQVVIRDARTWRKMWRRMHEGVISPVPSLPRIDFSRQMIVIVGLGTRSTGGYGITVDRAFQRDGTLEVIVSKHAPGKNCFTSQALTQPVDVVQLPKTKRKVVFKEAEVVHDCK